MDKKSLIGLALIGVVLFGFTWYNSYQQKKIIGQKAVADSIFAAQHPEVKTDPADLAETLEAAFTPREKDSVSPQPAVATADSAFRARFGAALSGAVAGEEQTVTMENDVLKLTLSSKGGRVVSAELKEYRKYDGSPLMLFEERGAQFDLSFFINRNYNNLQINTADYYFTPSQNEGAVVGAEASTLVMRLPVDSTAAVEYRYTLAPDSYMVDFEVRFVGMQELLSNQSDFAIQWGNTAPQTEKGYSNENTYTDITYHYPGESGIEKLGVSKSSKSEEIKTKVQWVAFKKQFFSSILVADNGFQGGDVGYETCAEGSGAIKKFHARLSVPFNPSTSDYRFGFYFGPNKYTVLKAQDLKFEKLIPLGGWIVGWINRWVVIPVFDFLGQHIASFGLVILILTILLKLVISPLTYKSYLSTAKMRLLKPEMEEINARFPKQEDAMKKQQATMELYKKAGVSPMGGCIPMLIQFPILFAMFHFFPASIELRGRSFLWADDLSSYDSIWTFPSGFSIPFYGDHISLFALLMGVTMFVSSKISYNQTASAGPQMAGMKFMMLYLMPVMMVCWFNNYASGLTYYYTVSTLITIVQTYGMRYMVDDAKLHAQMKANAKKPAKKKSKFAQRYEDMLKAQQQQMKQQAKKK